MILLIFREWTLEMLHDFLLSATNIPVMIRREKKDVILTVENIVQRSWSFTANKVRLIVRSIARSIETSVRRSTEGRTENCDHEETLKECSAGRSYPTTRSHSRVKRHDIHAWVYSGSDEANKSLVLKLPIEEKRSLHWGNCIKLFTSENSKKKQQCFCFNFLKKKIFFQVAKTFKRYS